MLQVQARKIRTSSSGFPNSSQVTNNGNELKRLQNLPAVLER